MDVFGSSKEPLISVVMCVYNGMPFIKDAVSCIFNQTYTNWELIISDDDSQDGTKEYLINECKDKRVRIYLQKKNLGYVANKNFVHQQAKGVYITQQDSDDLCEPRRLELQMNFLKSNPDIKIIGSGYKRIDKNGKVITEIAPIEPRLFSVPNYQDFSFWFPSLLVHREVFERVGFFDNYFSGVYGDDLYWTVKAIHHHFPIYCLQETLYSYRDNPKSLTNSYDNVRKLIVPAVLEYLFEQRKTKGTDWIEEKNFDALRKLEEDFMSNRVFMSKQHQIWAAKAIDNGNVKMAFKLIVRSFRDNPLNISLIRTILYSIRRSINFAS